MKSSAATSQRANEAGENCYLPAPAETKAVEVRTKEAAIILFEKAAVIPTTKEHGNESDATFVTGCVAIGVKRAHGPHLSNHACAIAHTYLGIGPHCGVWSCRWISISST
jgi:hypothetical protein